MTSRIEAFTPSPSASSSVPARDASLDITWQFNNLPVLDPLMLRDQLASQSQKMSGRLSTFWGKANQWIVVRGREPSYGHILLEGGVLRNALDNAPPGQTGHTLRIADGQRRVSFFGLVITRVTSVDPSYTDDPNTDSIDPATAYLVEVADPRWFCNNTTINHALNWRTGLGRLQPPNVTWQSLLTGMWNESFREILGPLSLDPTSRFPAWGPENLQPGGIDAWDYFHSLLDYLGNTLGPNVDGNGFIVYGPDTLNDQELSLFNWARQSFLRETEANPEVAELPEQVRVYFPSRDWQWWQYGCETPNAAAWWELNPVREQTLDTRLILPESHAPIVPGTIKGLFATVAHRTDERGNIVNQRALDDHAVSLARNWLIAQEFLDRFRSWTFHGVWPLFRVGPHLSAVCWYDHGTGVFTRLLTRPRDWSASDASRPWSPAYKPCVSYGDEIGGPPDLNRPDHPHSIEGYGFLNTPPGASSPSLYGPQPEICHEDYIGLLAAIRGVLPGRWGEVTLQRSSIAPDDSIQRWNPVCVIQAYNALDRTVPYGRRVFLRYNHQAGGDGRWEIVSWAATPTDVQQCCIPIVLPLPEGQGRVRDPDFITVRRDSSLRLVRRLNPPNDYSEAILDIGPGPCKMLFTSVDLNTPPRWMTDPAIDGSLTLGVGDKWIIWPPPPPPDPPPIPPAPPVLPPAPVPIPSPGDPTGSIIIVDPSLPPPPGGWPPLVFQLGPDGNYHGKLCLTCPVISLPPNDPLFGGVL